jgi:hypothetical protein
MPKKYEATKTKFENVMGETVLPIRIEAVDGRKGLLDMDDAKLSYFTRYAVAHRNEICFHITSRHVK